jgi:hypothetical protein
MTTQAQGECQKTFQLNTHYKTWKIKKKNGKYRTITAPSDSLKRKQKEILFNIPSKLSHDASHGFRKLRNIYTNATPHCLSRYLLNIDIANFFPSVKKKALMKALEDYSLKESLKSDISNFCFLKNSLPQGAPTSPRLADIFLLNFDNIFSLFCSKHNLTYTRYADDLSVSCKTDWLKLNTGLILSFIDFHLAKIGLIRSRQKTKLMPYYQRQEVTGLLVNGSFPRLSKKKRKHWLAFFSNSDIEVLSSKEEGVLNFIREHDLRNYNRICQLMTGKKKEEDRKMSNNRVPEYISRIKFFNTGGNGSLEGSGTFTVADSIAIKFSIFSNDGKMRLSLPSEKNNRFDPQQPVGKSNPKYYDQVYPISLDARKQLEETLINELLSLRQKEGGNSMDQTIPF